MIKLSISVPFWRKIIYSWEMTRNTEKFERHKFTFAKQGPLIALSHCWREFFCPSFLIIVLPSSPFFASLQFSLRTKIIKTKKPFFVCISVNKRDIKLGEKYRTVANTIIRKWMKHWTSFWWLQKKKKRKNFLCLAIECSTRLPYPLHHYSPYCRSNGK